MTKVLLIVLLFITLPFQIDEYAEARKKMVKEQIIARGVKDHAVIKALETVPRHKFVPDAQVPFAYNDAPLPIGFDQTISQPFIVAFMTESLKLKKTDRVLEIGTGSGYQASILAQIVSEVYTIEILEPLGLRAKQVIEDLNYKNITIKIGDGYYGWKEHAPFDAIIVTANVEAIPPELLKQMAEGGRMIIPVGPSHGSQNLVLLEKKNGNTKQVKLIPVRFVPFTRSEE
ncbi:MAG: protein-L-isoaspartate(D-aspartate) O-methyltransferase [Bacteroidales bacterium]|nr:protein-L-isoaspartate(D-aspartate) O-methyltransferase [Bacteroidales bacterium]MBN2821099.1 protein-L-isoaspartate(D-aspartate) O-methyltransferase [Bacteroidales bacterium]